jgi:hypothetical protein
MNCFSLKCSDNSTPLKAPPKKKDYSSKHDDFLKMPSNTKLEEILENAFQPTSLSEIQSKLSYYRSKKFHTHKKLQHFHKLMKSYKKHETFSFSSRSASTCSELPPSFTQQDHSHIHTLHSQTPTSSGLHQSLLQIDHAEYMILTIQIQSFTPSLQAQFSFSRPFIQLMHQYMVAHPPEPSSIKTNHFQTTHSLHTNYYNTRLPSSLSENVGSRGVRANKKSFGDLFKLLFF